MSHFSWVIPGGGIAGSSGQSVFNLRNSPTHFSAGCTTSHSQQRKSFLSSQLLRPLFDDWHIDGREMAMTSWFSFAFPQRLRGSLVLIHWDSGFPFLKDLPMTTASLDGCPSRRQMSSWKQNPNKSRLYRVMRSHSSLCGISLRQHSFFPKGRDSPETLPLQCFAPTIPSFGSFYEGAS